MAGFSTLRHFGDNFVNEDVLRQVSFYLNQREKIAMATASKSVNLGLQDYLPTSNKYVTTVQPNLLSAFTFSPGIGVYSAPIDTFQLSELGFFCSFHRSLITHAGANESEDFYSAWHEHHLKLRKGSARSPRGVIDLFAAGLPERDEWFLIERLFQSVDTALIDHHCLQYTQEIMDAIENNTSIVHVVAISQVSSCRCMLFDSLAERPTSLTSLELRGGICHDSTLTIGRSCVKKLRCFSFKAGDSEPFIDGFSVDYICEALADAGILEVLEIGGVFGDFAEWANGLIRVMATCPLRFLDISGAKFWDQCLPGMVRVLPILKAPELKITSCIFGGWARPVFEALFSNPNVSHLDLSSTQIDLACTGAVAQMITRGTLKALAIGGCGLGQDDIDSVLRATEHASSRLECLGMAGNDFQTFPSLDKTSLRGVHIGRVEGRAVRRAAVHFASRHGLELDMRDCDLWWWS